MTLYVPIVINKIYGVVVSHAQTHNSGKIPFTTYIMIPIINSYTNFDPVR